MVNIDDWQNAFGQADDEFQGNVYRTLLSLPQSEEKKFMTRRSFQLIALLGLVLILSTGTALALSNTWGVLDILNGRYANSGEVLPEAAAIIQQEPAQSGGQSEYGDFTLREAIFDGEWLYITVTIKPASSEYLLLGTDANPTDPIGNLGPLFAKESGTIGDYAADRGLRMIHTSVGLKIDGSYSVGFFSEDDGTLVYILQGSYKRADHLLNLELPCVIAPYTEKDGKEIVDAEKLQKTTIVAELKNTGAKETKTNIGSIVFEDCGISVDKLTLTGTEMAVYYQIEYSVIDQAAFDLLEGGLMFEFLDKEGNVLSNGVISSWTGTDGALTAMESLPEDIILRPYNCWEKTRYEARSIELR